MYSICVFATGIYFTCFPIKKKNVKQNLFLYNSCYKLKNKNDLCAELQFSNRLNVSAYKTLDRLPGNTLWFKIFN